MDIRSAAYEDCDILFQWVNDPLIRKMAFSKEKIDYASHEKWFLSRLAHDYTKIYIAVVKEVPVGQVRFDFNGDFFEIDVHLAPEERGKGYASVMLEKGYEALFSEFPKATIRAVVKSGNSASYKALTRAGFIMEGIETIHGESCYVLSLTSN